jgi:hypothetical protein
MYETAQTTPEVRARLQAQERAERKAEATVERI